MAEIIKYAVVKDGTDQIGYPHACREFAEEALSTILNEKICPNLEDREKYHVKKLKIIILD